MYNTEIEKIASEILSPVENAILIEKIAEEVLGDVFCEKTAREREGRIDSYKDFYNKDKLLKRTIERNMDRADNRYERAGLRNELSNTKDKGEKKEIKHKIGDLKHERNKMIVGQIKDSANPMNHVRQYVGALKAELNPDAPWNIIVPTPGKLHDMSTAKSLANRDYVLNHEHHKKAEEREILVDKIAQEIIESALEK